MDLHLTAAAATPAERAAVDALLGKPASRWEGGERQAGDGAREASGGHAARARRHLLLPALHAVRGVSWRAGRRLAELERRGERDTTEYRTLQAFVARAPLQNYFMDKGWLAAVDHFAECIRTGGAFQGATAHDAYMASRITEAAIASRSRGQVVYLPAT